MPGVFTASSATLPPCGEPIRTVQHRGDALAMFVVVQAARWIPVLRHAAARLRVEAARHHQRGARKARLELECNRDHRLRSGAAAMQEHEQALDRVLWSGCKAENPAGRHWENCYPGGAVL